MRRSLIIVVSLGSLLSVASGASAQAVADAQSVRGTLAFDAKANVGDFTGTTTKMTGKLEGASALSGVRGWVEAPAKSLTTKNGHRDSDMAKSLEMGKYPAIRFDLDSVAPGAAQGDSTAVVLKGRFTLHGKTRAASIPGWVWITSKGARFRGAVPIDVKDYGVGGLTHFLVFKMNEMITV
ncbi:MAG: YceI family protein, partial [Gemmatimonadaceae bacterium]